MLLDMHLYNVKAYKCDYKILAIIIISKMHFEQDTEILRQQQQQNWLERYLSQCSISSTNEEIYVTLRPVRLSMDIVQPKEYNSTRDNKPFKCAISPATYPFGEFEYYVLTEPITFEFKNLALSARSSENQLTTCYVCQFEPRLTIWQMNGAHLIDINSTMYDMAIDKKLKGKVEYLSLQAECHSFMIESWSKFYSKSGRRVTYKSNSICKAYLDRMDANVILKFSGIVQNTRTGIIKGLLYVHEFRVVNPIHVLLRKSKTMTTTMTMMSTPNNTEDEASVSTTASQL